MAGRALFVASAGGHLEELHALEPSLLGAGQLATWVTFESPQSRALLAGEPTVQYVPRVGSRGYLELARSFWPALRTLRRVHPDVVYSTGAGIALAYLPFAWLAGARARYIESAARTDGPSLTGRLLSLMPWVGLRTQYRSWAGDRWQFAGSVFDEYVARRSERPRPIRRVLVTLGTQEGYPFVSLVRRLRQIIPAGVQASWQLGPDFPKEERPPGASEMISRDELSAWIEECDVVVTHAGVGSALAALEAEHTPVLVPRSARRGEHVDDHQRLIADELSARGLAVTAAPDELVWDDLVRAASIVVERAGRADGRRSDHANQWRFVGPT
jgi:UDP-N-acetylglucosamine--N-acetylmuramyl-(pentapeptide) pyrophosphoryl-undecaprenol N-acetylglucosamine transferase